jgi:hypothetical protein
LSDARAPHEQTRFHVFVLVAWWENMVSVRVGFRAYERGPFDEASAAESDFHDPVNELGNWWRDYRDVHGYPSQDFVSRTWRSFASCASTGALRMPIASAR